MKEKGEKTIEKLADITQNGQKWLRKNKIIVLEKSARKRKTRDVKNEILEK